jgi:hypothetical protein
MPVAVNTAMIAASRRAANYLPWQGLSSSDSSTLVKRGLRSRLSLARVMRPGCCHEKGTAWRHG